MSVLELAEAGPLKLPLSEIRIDSDLQCRAYGVSAATVREYAEAMREGAVFPGRGAVQGQQGHALVG